jgi:hypothetical protein
MRERSQRASSVAASRIQNAHMSPSRQCSIIARCCGVIDASSRLYFCMPPTLSTLGHRP